jgi:hypothetical protein
MYLHVAKTFTLLVYYKTTHTSYIATKKIESTIMTGQLTSQEAKRQQLQQSSQHAHDVETQEHHAKASASVSKHHHQKQFQQINQSSTCLFIPKPPFI